MAIEDQIKDEKLQLSALSSGKIDKYEYLTGEEILPSNQQQIIQQAKFAYSPLGKAFEKQIKTIEDQGNKQVKAIQDKQIVNINNKNDYKDYYKDKLLFSRERDIFKGIYNKRLDRIEELDNKIDYINLEYPVYNKRDLTDFSKLIDPLTFLDKIKKGEITLETAKDYQKVLLENVKPIRKGNKNIEQKKV